MIKIEVMKDKYEEIASGLYGHSFIIPRIGEHITYQKCSYLIENIDHEFIGEGSVLQTSKIIIYVKEV